MKIRRAISVAAVGALTAGVLAFASPAIAEVSPASQPPNCTKLLNEIKAYTDQAAHYKAKGEWAKAKHAAGKADHARKEYNKYC